MAGGEYKQPVSVLVVVVAPGAILSLERTEPAGFWQSVTGSLEDGESRYDAARREVEEETGLDAAQGLIDLEFSSEFPIAPAWRHRYAPDVTSNTEHAFALAVSGPVPVRLEPDAHVQARWLTPWEALRRASSWTDRLAIRHVIARMR